MPMRAARVGNLYLYFTHQMHVQVARISFHIYGKLP